MYRKKVENQLIVDNKEGVSVTSKTSPVSFRWSQKEADGIVQAQQEMLVRLLGTE
jgi:hypothetical protein